MTDAASPHTGPASPDQGPAGPEAAELAAALSPDPNLRGDGHES